MSRVGAPTRQDDDVGVRPQAPAGYRIVSLLQCLLVSASGNEGLEGLHPACIASQLASTQPKQHDAGNRSYHNDDNDPRGICPSASSTTSVTVKPEHEESGMPSHPAWTTNFTLPQPAEVVTLMLIV